LGFSCSGRTIEKNTLPRLSIPCYEISLGERKTDKEIKRKGNQKTAVEIAGAEPQLRAASFLPLHGLRKTCLNERELESHEGKRRITSNLLKGCFLL